ncbi:Mitochondrial import inner membrane translocase subunit tim23 [Acropora cervicornis]|uniref:Mitochondrial import inner membrane translocase subunit tim23 n=1 Tax=Acropora cervicornis TaxID=6130 RepID=A0AAD9QAM2_ACRCE|nr:PREDICTED: mitochondrial import inner membrane translocase subunit tim23-like [Acropora digitifera]KAK2557877.1 Mitochondrial import inner membrane translocase subunit tim23 [Acropora cervicornis]
MDLGNRGGDYSMQDPNTAYSVNRGASLSPYLNIDPTYLNQGGAEFVFPTDSKKKRSWGERMFSGIGTSYMCGLAMGGTWGLYEGLRNPDGKTLKLRVNSVLNGCTRRGPSFGNSLGVLALMYCSLDTLIGKLRGGEEDEYNSVGAATLTGMIFKSTAGLRPIAIAGGVGAGIATAYHLGEKLWNSRGHSISTPNWA